MAPVLDVMDETYVVAAAEDLRPLLCDEAAWASWFPGLTLTCYADRGPLGKRWALGGALRGSCEVWLEQLPGGTVVHLFWQATPPGEVRPTRRLRLRLERRYARRLRTEVAAVKARFDAQRPAGELRSFPVPRDKVTSPRARRRGRRITTEEDQADGRADHE